MTDWPSTLAECVTVDVQIMAGTYAQFEAEGSGVPNDTGVSNWRWPSQLTNAEQKVFDLDREIWPRCIVALAAYAHFTGEGSLTPYPEAVYEEARRTHAYIADAHGRDVEAFAEFAHVFCELDERDAYAALWKEEAWHLREGHRFFIRLGHDPRGPAMSANTPQMAVRELAEKAGGTEQILLRRIADVLQRRPWHRRMLFRLRAWWSGVRV
jgi:hypothetical protein